MDVEEALALLGGVQRDEFIGALAWYVANGKPITVETWKETADLCRK